MGLALAVEMGQGSRAGVGCWGFACGVLAHGQHNQLLVVEEDQQKKIEKWGLRAVARGRRIALHGVARCDCCNCHATNAGSGHHTA